VIRLAPRVYQQNVNGGLVGTGMCVLNLVGEPTHKAIMASMDAEKKAAEGG
jgi:hypothetical protein